MAAVVLLLAACGGGSAATPTASSVPEPSTAAEAASPTLPPAANVAASPTSAATPARSFDVKAAAAAAYLSASTAANAGFAAALAKLPRENATLKQLRTWGAAMAKAELKLDEQVKAIAFPPAMTGKVTAYLLQRSELASVERTLGAATTIDEALSGFNKAAALSSAAGKIARSIRADLGLPAPPVLSN